MDRGSKATSPGTAAPEKTGARPLPEGDPGTAARDSAGARALRERDPAMAATDNAGVRALPERDPVPRESTGTRPLRERDPDRYEIIGEQGRGGVGRVMRVNDRDFDRDVALKELLHRSPAAEARFVREAIITSRLEHPNIVPVHEVGRWPDGRPFYTMKLVSGRPLEELIQEATTYRERRGLLEHVLAVCDAIAYAHDRGVIHRDLKPSNIIVGPYGETIVIDWGLAKYLSDPDEQAGSSGSRPESTAVDLTTVGTILGTPAYMAPEQAFGGPVTARTDVYALGVILLDVLAGRSPAASASRSPSFDRATTAGVAKAGALPREVESGVPADLRSIVRRAMTISADDRYADAHELGDDLRRFLAGQPVRAHRYTRSDRAARWLGSHRRLVQGSAAVLIALLLASIAFLARESRLRGEADDARRTAESERDRADRQSLALLEQQGRAELAAGRPFRAAPILAEAYRRDRMNIRVRWLLTETLRALDSIAVTFDASVPGSDPGRPTDLTRSVSMAPDDSELMTGQERGVSFWDPTSGALRRRLALPWTGILAHHDRAGDGLLLLVAEGGGESPLRSVDRATGRESAQVPAGMGIDFAGWSVDGRHAASIRSDGSVDVWSIAKAPTATRLFSFQAGSQPVFGSLAMSPDGALVAVRGKAELILASVANRVVRRLPVPGEEVQQVAFSPDSRQLLTTMADRSIRIWDVASSVPRGKLRAHDGIPLAAAFSEDGSLVASADSNSLFLWDASSTMLLTRFDLQAGEITVAATFAHHRPRLVTTSLTGRVRIWDLSRDRWARPLSGHRGWVRGKYLPGTARIVTADGQDGRGQLRVWEANGGRLESSSALEWHSDCDLAVTADGTRVAFLGRDGRPRVADPRSGTVQLVLDQLDARVLDLSFSPDGRRLAAASSAGIAQVWSVEEGGRRLVALRHPRTFSSVEFSPDGSQLLTGSDDHPSRLWNSTTGQLVRELPESSGRLVGFSPDGRRMITGGAGGDRRPRIWDAASGELVSEIEARGNVVSSVSFSADGGLVATADDDGKTTIWDTSTGLELRSIAGPTESRLFSSQNSAVHTVEFSPDGKRLLTTGAGYALLWNVEVDQRSPGEVDAVVAAKSPWRLVAGRLSRRGR